MFEEGEEETAGPKFRCFFKIGDMPYEFDQYQVVQHVSTLLHHGATEVQVRRFITDDNLPNSTLPRIVPDEPAHMEG